MIKAENLVKKFGAFTAVDNISFDVQEGENLVFLGKSGCGKTTTLRMINRLLSPDSGTVSINGTNTADVQPEILRRGIGYVLQNHGLFPHYTVAENVAIVPRLLKWTNGSIHQRMDELFAKLKLDVSLKTRFPSALSGGQQQRIGLARALMVNPPILLMDEPFGALDNITRTGIRKEFRVLDELVKKTVVMVTHDIQEAFELGDRICLMDKGRIVQVGTPAALLFKPAHAFVSEFLQEQRLQLEMKTLRLKDVLRGATTNPAVTVWEKMEGLLSNRDPESLNDETDIEGLMRAFRDYKQR